MALRRSDRHVRLHYERLFKRDAGALPVRSGLRVRFFHGRAAVASDRVQRARPLHRRHGRDDHLRRHWDDDRSVRALHRPKREPQREGNARRSRQRRFPVRHLRPRRRRDRARRAVRQHREKGRQQRVGVDGRSDVHEEVHLLGRAARLRDRVLRRIVLRRDGRARSRAERLDVRGHGRSRPALPHSRPRVR